MTAYQYLLPLISVAPPPGYRLVQTISATDIGELLDSPDATVRVFQTLLLNGAEIGGETHVVTFEDGAPSVPFARIEVPAPIGDGWVTGGALAYLETHAEVDGEARFASHFPPDFYTVYCGPERKSFFSDNALKYGNTVTIYQIQAFGAWVEGYPISVVDRARDADESLVLINPFMRPAVVDVILEGIAGKKRFRIDPQSGRRISLAQAFEIGEPSWSGQVYVSGRNRVVMYIAKHSLADPANVTTVEHSNPYRGESTHVAVSQVVRQRIGMGIKSVLSGR